ncbi:hypothetical protein ACCO45_002660 [Purpureocillium lilacinum]|uniref:Uncharacterized protein n=1 Tax=Purpureocillium lilacinum TaxID=33203 RepID=A0ACC4EAI8_PURLI
MRCRPKPLLRPSETSQIVNLRVEDITPLQGIKPPSCRSSTIADAAATNTHARARRDFRGRSIRLPEEESAGPSPSHLTTLGSLLRGQYSVISCSGSRAALLSAAVEVPAHHAAPIQVGTCPQATEAGGLSAQWRTGGTSQRRLSPRKTPAYRDPAISHFLHSGTASAVAGPRLYRALDPPPPRPSRSLATSETLRSMDRLLGWEAPASGQLDVGHDPDEAAIPPVRYGKLPAPLERPGPALRLFRFPGRPALNPADVSTASPRRGD